MLCQAELGFPPEEPVLLFDPPCEEVHLTPETLSPRYIMSRRIDVAAWHVRRLRALPCVARARMEVGHGVS
jgi:hypothetical protein